MHSLGQERRSRLNRSKDLDAVMDQASTGRTECCKCNPLSPPASPIKWAMNPLPAGLLESGRPSVINASQRWPYPGFFCTQLPARDRNCHRSRLTKTRLDKKCKAISNIRGASFAASDYD
jgi:hypothetical protein